MPDSTEPPLDRRRQRGLRTREALVQAALERFERFGFDKTTVDEIAADVGMSPRTLFHHFGSKEMLLFAGYAERLQEATRQFRSCDPALPLTTALDATADSIVTAITAQSDVFLRRGRLQLVSPTLRATMLRINEEWIDGLALEIRRRLDLDVDDTGARLIAAISNGAMRVAIDAWVAADGAEDLATVAATTQAIVRPAVAEFEQARRRVGAR